MRAGFAALLMLVLTATLAHSQPAGPPPVHKNHAVTWTQLGAGAGFALGTLAGLGCSTMRSTATRKVWDNRGRSAAAGGVVAFLLSLPHKAARHAAPAGLTDVEVRALAASARFQRTTPFSLTT
jgi:hypothetical protein